MNFSSVLVLFFSLIPLASGTSGPNNTPTELKAPDCQPEETTPVLHSSELQALIEHLNKTHPDQKGEIWDEACVRLRPDSWILKSPKYGSASRKTPHLEEHSRHFVDE